MTVDEKRLTSLQVIVSSFLVLSLSYVFSYLFILKRRNTANTGFTFITGRVRLTPGCEFWGQLHCMRMCVEKPLRCGRKQSERATEKRGFGSGRCLPRRVTASVWARYFGGHWNPVSVNTCIEPPEERRCCEATHGQAGATGHHSLNTVPWVCLLLRCLLSYMTTAVFAHAGICNRSKCDVMCGTEWHHAGTNVFI